MKKCRTPFPFPKTSTFSSSLTLTCVVELCLYSLSLCPFDHNPIFDRNEVFLDAFKEASGDALSLKVLMNDGGDCLTAGETKFHDVRKLSGGIVHRNVICDEQTLQGF